MLASCVPDDPYDLAKAPHRQLATEAPYGGGRTLAVSRNCDRPCGQ